MSPQEKESTDVGNAITLKGHTVPLVELKLSHVTYAPVATTAKGKKASSSRVTVLNDICTKISPYKLTAWMGPSGSGKVRASNGELLVLVDLL